MPTFVLSMVGISETSYQQVTAFARSTMPSSMLSLITLRVWSK